MPYCPKVIPKSYFCLSDFNKKHFNVSFVYMWSNILCSSKYYVKYPDESTALQLKVVILR